MKMGKAIHVWGIVLVLSMCVTITSFAEYQTCATYFSDAWPMNFWNSESVHMEEELAQIAEDGFTGIILVVPWREFQPMTVPYSYNQTAFQKLDRVMESAKKAGLRVYLRLGYTWDSYNPQESCLERYQNLVVDGGRTRAAWIDYAKTVYTEVSQYDNFAGGFITWEDFWNFTNTNAIDRYSSKGFEMAQMSGYVKYAIEHYSLEELSELYEEEITNQHQIVFPPVASPAMEVFYDFYDSFLMELLKETQEVFPGLSMEVRTDSDYIQNSNGEGWYYSHKKTYSCEGADYTAIMYGIPTGFQNAGQKVSAKEAAEMSQAILKRTYETAGKPLFIEQFLFVDNTPGYEMNVQVREEELGEYLNRASNFLDRYSMGYGIWTYRNYCDNKLYNAQFALGKERWKMNGNAEIREISGNQKAVLKKNGMISQSVVQKIPKDMQIYVSFLAESEDGCLVTVSVAGQTQSVWVQGEQTVTLAFSGGELNYVTWESDGDVFFDDMKVYTYIQDGKLYEIDGREGSCIQEIRRMNERLRNK